MAQTKWIVLGSALAIALVTGGSCVHKYNELITLDQQVQGQWAQVQVAYERRADLIPNLLATVKGAANFEKSTYVAVTEARTRAQQASQSAGPEIVKDPAKVHAFEAAEANLGGQISRLMVVAENYPDLKATQNFRDFQAQLEGSENRISVERQRFNDSARAFNTVRDSFPMNMVAGVFGSKFTEKTYLAAKTGADVAPTVTF